MSDDRTRVDLGLTGNEVLSLVAKLGDAGLTAEEAKKLMALSLKKRRAVVAAIREAMQ